MDYKKTINWGIASKLGLIYKINKEVLHPLGMAMTKDTFGRSNVILVNDEPYTFSQELIDRNEEKLKSLDKNLKDLFKDFGAPLDFKYKYRVTDDAKINIELNEIIKSVGYHVWDEDGSISFSSGIVYDEMYPFLLYSEDDNEFVMSNSDKGVELTLSEFKKQLKLIKSK